MDELELLKKHWKKDEANYPKVSYDEIYTMTHKKSSSIVKWIFIISIIEFSIGIALILINPKFENQVELPLWLDIASYLTLPVIAYFIYKFYQNFKKISASDHVKGLISNILTARKTVKYYIGFNLIFVALLSPFMFYFSISEKASELSAINTTANFGDNSIIIISALIGTAVLIAFFYGIYYLLYGILLKRLNKNYKELEKLDM